MSHPIGNLTPKQFFLDTEPYAIPNEETKTPQAMYQIGIYDPEHKKGFEMHIERPAFLQQTFEKIISHPGYQIAPKYSFDKVWMKLQRWIFKRCEGKHYPEFITYYGEGTDVPLIQQEVARLGKSIPRHWHFTDFSWSVKKLKPQPDDRTLLGLCKHFQVAQEIIDLPEHRAYNDALKLQAVYARAVGNAPPQPLVKAVETTAKKSDRKAILIILDTETTGLFPDNRHPDRETPRVVQLAAYCPEFDLSFDTFVNPEIPIPAEAMNIHHITDADVKDAPTFLKAWEAYRKFEEQIRAHMGPTQTLVRAGHNVTFDLKVLKEDCKRVGLTKEVDAIYRRTVPVFDTLHLVSSLYKGKRVDVIENEKVVNKSIHHVKGFRTLQTFRWRFGIAEDSAHRADGDVRVNWLVLKKLIEGVPEKEFDAMLLSNSPGVNVAQLIRDKGTFDPDDYMTLPPPEAKPTAPLTGHKRPRVEEDPTYLKRQRKFLFGEDQKEKDVILKGIVQDEEGEEEIFTLEKAMGMDCEYVIKKS